MGGIFKGIRKPGASKTMGAQRYKSGGIVNYEYNPYERYGWGKGVEYKRPESTAPVVDETVVDETVVAPVVVDNSSNNNNTGIVTPTPITTPDPIVYDNPFDVVDNNPIWSQPESSIVPGGDNFSWDGAGGTSYGDDYSAVIEAANDLPPVTTDSGGNLVPVSAGNFTPVTAYAPEIGDMVDNNTMREIQNAEVERSFENFGENILNNPNLTPEQIAAANPAFNVGASEAHAQVPVTITNPTTGDSYTKPAGSLTSEDFANALPGDGTSNAITIGDIPGSNLFPVGQLLSDVEIPGTGGDTGGNYTGVVDDYGYIDSSQGGFSGPGTGGNEDLIARQYELAGQSAAAAGIRNIGGSYAQDGIGSANAPIVETRYNPATGLSEVIGIEEQAQAEAEPEKLGIIKFLESLGGGGGVPADQLTAAGAATAERGQAEGRALAASRVAEEQQTAQTHAGITDAQYNSLSGVEQIGVDIGKDVDLSIVGELIAGDDSGYYGTARGNLSRQGLSTAQVNEVIDAYKGGTSADQSFLEQGQLAEIQAAQPKTVGQNNTGIVGGAANALNIGANPATTAAGSGLYSAAQGTDVIAGTGGQTRAEVNAGHQELLQQQGLGANQESASSQRKDEADRSERQTNADVIATDAAADPDIANLRGDDAKAYLNSVGAGNYAKEDAQDALQNFIADGTATPEPVTEAETQTAQEQLAAGVPAEQVRANLDTARAEPTQQEVLYENAVQNLETAATDAGYTSAVGKVLAEVHGWSAEQIAAAGYNRGGIVHRAKGGKINIKPSRKGIFTAKAKDAGETTQGYARKVMSAKKGIYSPSLRKQANFALNSSKWN